MKHLYVYGLALSALLGFTAAAELGVLPGNQTLNIKAEGAQTIDIITKPADGATVSSLSTVTVICPWMGDDVMMDADAENLKNFKVTKDSETVATIKEDEELGIFGGIEAGMDDDQNTTLVIYLSSSLNEEGEYVINIPAGAFIQKEWDNDSESFLPVAGGYTSNEYTATITISSNAPSVFSEYTLTPADGETVAEIQSINLDFTQLAPWQVNGMQFPGATISNGEEELEVFIGRDLNAEEFETFIITPQKDYDDYVITEPGTWILTIPAGIFTTETDSNPEITAEYIIEADTPAFELTPTPGSTIDNLEFTLSFPKATEVTIGSGYMVFVKLGWKASCDLECEKIEGASVPTFKLTPEADAMKIPNGTIDLCIYEGSFVIDGKDSEDIMVQYTLDAPVSTEYSLEPNNGTVPISDGWVYVAFVFDEAASVGYIEKDKVSVSIDDVALNADSFELEAGGNMLMVNIGGEELKAGKLKVEIEAGALVFGKTVMPTVTGVWTIIENKTFTAEVTPAGKNGDVNKVYDLSTVTINFPDASSAEIFNPNGASLSNSTYTYRQTGKIEIEEATRAEGVTVKVTFDPAPTEAGDYTFTLLHNTITLDSEYANDDVEQEFEFDKTTGIVSAIADENGNVSVFTLDGKQLLNNAPAATVRDLDNGVYIINGRKTIVK